MMKRMCFFILMVLLAAVPFAGCGSGSGAGTGGGLPGETEAAGGPDRRVKVVSTIFAPYDFAREIAGDRADIAMLLPPASESHS
ncbi:MAG: hypothetical protein LBT26_00355, partial [Clostridiales Family XIII bacterium]|nr:hypothetical protein [Clostridiales Family XIII bacterium]